MEKQTVNSQDQDRLEEGNQSSNTAGSGYSGDTSQEESQEQDSNKNGTQSGSWTADPHGDTQKKDQ